MGSNIVDFSKGKGKKSRKKNDPAKTSTSVSEGPKYVGLPCKVCNERHKKYMVVQMLIAALGQPQAIPLMICPSCGYTFIPQDVLDKLNVLDGSTETPICRPSRAQLRTPSPKPASDLSAEMIEKPVSFMRACARYVLCLLGIVGRCD